MSNLPRGVRIDHGYVQVRLSSRGVVYCRNFGLDSPKARELAIIHLSKKREEILLGKFGYEPELPTKTFADVADLFLHKWAAQTTPEGLPKHTPKAIQNVRSFIERSLVPFFGRMEFSGIQPRNVQEWRDKRVQTILGTSANREQAVLSSIFSHTETWVKSSQIKPFKLPAENPTTHIEFAKTRKRERIPSLTELKEIKAACFRLGDTHFWEVCKINLKSLLRKKDLLRVEAGQEIDLIQAKTLERIQLPMGSKSLNMTNLRKRWEAVRLEASRVLPAIIEVQFRDFRKKAANMLKDKNWSNKIISEVLGHTNTRTTEVYMIKDQEHLRKPLEDLSGIVDSI